jgi:hypothetical protein
MKAKFFTLGLALLMTVPAAVVQAQNSDIEVPVQLEDYPYGEVIPTEIFPDMGMYNGVLCDIDVKKYDTVYVVNSAEEFEKLLEVSTALVALPPFPVDFEKQTVLVVRGREASQNDIWGIKSVLTKNGDQYNLDITITHTGASMPPAVWEVALITDKIDTDFVSLYNVILKAPTAIDEIATSEGLVYPTITDGALNIRSAGAYRIFGLQGNTLLSGSAVKGQPIDVSALKSGIYLIQAEGKTGKFIKK